MTLYIIRHGETELNRQGIVQGSGVDSDLNKMGQRQAHLFYQYYKNIDFDFIVTSALKRTHQTVEPFLRNLSDENKILSELNISNWLTFKELNEISWGVQEGQKSNPAMHDTYLKLMTDWANGIYETRFENGESATELHTRVSKIVDYLKDNHAGQNVLMCTHGRTLLCLLTILKNEPLNKMNQYKHQNTCLYKAHFVDGEFHFELENDVRHLGKMETVDF
jgi:phosphoserine phosphatase